MSESMKKFKNENQIQRSSKKAKKNANANLENYSKLFAQLGLVLSLLVVYILIQNKSYDKEVIAMSVDFNRTIDDETSLVEYKIKPKPIPKKKVILKSIKIIDNETPQKEDDFIVIDVDTPVKDPVFIPVDEDDDPIIEIIPFVLIEDVPVFPGCDGSNKERKACFEKKIAKFINKKFDASLAESLGLSSGKQKIFTVFKIDENGNVVDIEARAPHKKLQQEAIRVIRLLPKMEPGMQRKKPVVVGYSLPITFRIE